MRWVNRKARYPYVNVETWTTRGWLLLRKIDRQSGYATITDRRVAIEILRLAPRNAGPDLCRLLEEVIVDAPDPYAPIIDPATPQARLGSGADEPDRDRSGGYR